jgi:hypothetical protein
MDIRKISVNEAELAFVVTGMKLHIVKTKFIE